MPYELIRDSNPCPTPTKKGYDRKSSALHAAHSVRHRFEVTPYLCACGRYHLTSQGGRNDHFKSRGGRPK